MEQCIQAAKKAQSILGMINMQFKIIDKKDFGIRPQFRLLYPGMVTKATEG